MENVQDTLRGRLSPVDTMTGRVSGETSTVSGRLTIPSGSGAGGLPPGGLTGDLLAKRSDSDYAVEWITPATSAEEDNTRPITAAAVYTEIGNINALLAII